MCGIIGVTGSDAATTIILEGLHRLEYRGYDSAGVALQSPQGIWRSRAATGTQSVKTLFEQCNDAPTSVVSGIGHTRWATHGHPNTENAHPHLDCTGRLALIHNGIIENHDELRTGLLERGHVFTSVTDTEVVCHLLEEELAVDQDLAAALRRTLAQCRGAFGIAAITADDPDLIVAARRISPLIIGRSESASYLASDIPALLGVATELYALDDDQMVELRPGSIVLTDLEGNAAPLIALDIDWDLEVAEKDGYPDFMTKEIHEQPHAVATTLLDRVHAGHLDLDELRISDDDLRTVNKIVLLGCGSSYHASLVGKFAFEAWARISSDVDIASEFRYRDAIIDEHTLAIGVSQSGESVDTLQAIRAAKERGAKVLVVTNIVDSSMAREADGALYTRAGLEVCVASTKTVLAQVVALELLALRLAELRGTLDHEEIFEILGHLRALPAQLEVAIARGDAVHAVAETVKEATTFFFLGRHAGFPVALEGALKLKELSYLHAEGYPAGELKHGPIALIEPGTVVVAICTRGPLTEKMRSNIAEVQSRGATVIAVADDGDEETAALCDHVLWVPEVSPLLSPVINMVPLQFLAYSLATLRGLDVDRPRNLAKTVTVE